MEHGISVEEIGERMKAFRLGASLTSEEIAIFTGASRAAIYRDEPGQPAKIDTLVRNVDVQERKDIAHVEIENMVHLVRSKPIGVQLGVVVDSMPGASLQLFKQANRTSVGVSPFRLGALANFRLGVATISPAPDAIELYKVMTNQLWSRSLNRKICTEIAGIRLVFQRKFRIFYLIKSTEHRSGHHNRTKPGIAINDAIWL